MQTQANTHSLFDARTPAVWAIRLGGRDPPYARPPLQDALRRNFS